MKRTAAFIALFSIALPLAAADAAGTKQQPAKSNETTSAPAVATEKAVPSGQHPTVLASGVAAAGEESPLVAAARRSNRGKGKPGIVITNSTLAQTSGAHFSVAPGAKTARSAAASGTEGNHPAPAAAVDAAAAKAKAEKARVELARVLAAQLEQQRKAKAASEELLEGNTEALDAMVAQANEAAPPVVEGQSQPTPQPKPPL